MARTFKKSKSKDYTNIKRIKAVFFDFGGTLVNFKPSREMLFKRCCDSIGLNISLGSIKTAYSIVDFSNRFSSLTISNPSMYEDFYKDYNRKLCEVLGIVSYYSRLYPRVKAKFKKEGRWVLYNDVKFVLLRLKRKNIHIGIIANWDRRLSQLLESLSIRSYFRYVFSSQDVGIEKPDSALFKLALSKLTFPVKRREVLYVCNEYKTDVLPAILLGITPILIDREGFYQDPDCMKFISLKDWYNSLNF